MWVQKVEKRPQKPSSSFVSSLSSASTVIATCSARIKLLKNQIVDVMLLNNIVLNVSGTQKMHPMGFYN